MAKREMVRVSLYEDGNYEVKDVESYHVTQRMWGVYDGKHVDIYYCLKSKWKYYLLKLLSTNDIDKQIAELKKKKRMMEKLRDKIAKEIEKDGKGNN